MAGVSMKLHNPRIVRGPASSSASFASEDRRGGVKGEVNLNFIGMQYSKRGEDVRGAQDKSPRLAERYRNLVCLLVLLRIRRLFVLRSVITPQEHI